MAEGRGGVVKKFLDHTTPSVRSMWLRGFLRDRATNPDGPPPAEGGECSRAFSFLHLRLLQNHCLLFCPPVRIGRDTNKEGVIRCGQDVPGLV